MTPRLLPLTRFFVRSLCGVLALTFATDAAQADVPLGLKPVPHPEDNQPTPEKIALGKQLYFDARLSSDNTISCASCHDPKLGWSNGERFATGVGGQKGGRSAPSIINAAYYKFQFWDGRERTLEGQALGPIANPIEMNLPIKDAVARLNKIEGYRKQFQKVFGTDATADALAKAIASFERTVLSGDAPYDRFKAGDEKALSEAAERGRKLFFSPKAQCSACHAGPNFSDTNFHSLELGKKEKSEDIGRAAITKQDGDKFAFKTPTLRDIHTSAPYMHDGRFKTLEEVVEFYAKLGEIDTDNGEILGKPLKLTEQDKKDIVTFLKEGLKSSKYPTATAPKLPQ
ncbi:MAG: c-type cytochrome [Planctomycetota bacterium]|nr:c-type cytochrome [Planctomycetota bacterium]